MDFSGFYGVEIGLTDLTVRRRPMAEILADNLGSLCGPYADAGLERPLSRPRLLIAVLPVLALAQECALSVRDALPPTVPPWTTDEHARIQEAMSKFANAVMRRAQEDLEQME